MLVGRQVCMMTLSCAGDLLNCGKLFVRWLHGSCLPAPPQKSGGEDVSVFTFFNDISANPEVSILMHQIVNTLKVLYTPSDANYA